MTRHPAFGLFLAAFGAILISPDTLMMRLSGLDGWALLAWRGLLTALALLTAWVFLSWGRWRADVLALWSGAGCAVIVAQFVNSSLFSLAIAKAPVSIVLFGVATAPVFGAIFAWLILKEPTQRATWVTIAMVMFGIGLAVFGGADGRPQVDMSVILGALGGLCVAASLALTFVVYRMRPGLSIPLSVGTGSLLSGIVGLTLSGQGVWDGTLWPIMVSGLFLLPVSFFALSMAARFTHASNVSLLLLLETVLGPLIVWIGVGESMSMPMKIGGAIVVVSLVVYLRHAGRAAR